MSGVLIQHLKESICHMDPTLWGVKDYQFSVMTPIPGILHDYEIKLSDEAILAPLGVFFPQIFCLPPNVALMRGQELSPADNEDLFDEAHWTAEMGGAGGGAQGKITSKMTMEILFFFKKKPLSPIYTTCTHTNNFFFYSPPSPQKRC